MYRRLVVKHFGSSPELVEEVSPEPQGRQVRIRVLTAGLSFADLLVFEGLHPVRPTPPFTSLRCLRATGRLVVFGHATPLIGGARTMWKTLTTLTGTVAIFVPNLIPGGKPVRLYSIQTLKRSHPEWFRRDLTQLFYLLEQGRVRPIIAGVVSLGEAPQAFAKLRKGKVTGKLIIHCSPADTGQGTSRSAF